MEPQSPTQAPSNQEILNVIGGEAPQVQQPKKGPNFKLLIIVTVVVLIAVGGLAFLFTPRDKKTNLENFEPVQATINSKYVKEGLENIEKFTKLIDDGEFVYAQKVFLSGESELGSPELAQWVLDDVAGAGLAWNTCETIEKDTYEASQAVSAAEEVLSSAFVPVTCETIDGSSKRTLIFELHKSEESTWLVYAIKPEAEQ